MKSNYIALSKVSWLNNLSIYCCMDFDFSWIIEGEVLFYEKEVSRGQLDGFMAALMCEVQLGSEAFFN